MDEQLIEDIEVMLEAYDNASPPMDRRKFAAVLVEIIKKELGK